MKNTDKNKESRSMYLYTALIFVVALLLILIAFFSQTNITRLGKRAEEFSTQAPAAEVSQEPSSSEQLATISNMAHQLDSENKILKEQLNIYDELALANQCIADDEYEQADAIISSINADNLSENQKLLYEQIKEKLNERKEQ